MSLSPDSFDRLLADKLAQLPEPTYDPAHWDMLEDQLQHLAQQPTSSSGSQPQPAPPAPAAGTWLTGSFAKLGLVAALTGVTALNAYLYVESQPRPNPVAGGAPVQTTLLPPTPVAEPTPAVAAAAPTTDPAAATAPVDRPADPANYQAPVNPRLTGGTLSAPVAALPPSLPPTPAAATVDAAPAPAPAVTSGPVTDKMAPAVPAPPTEMTAPAVETATGAEAAPNFGESMLNRLGDGAYNIITPNGDGLNDRLELPLPAGACRLTVFDRTGKVVYFNDRYDNSWDASGLPAGEYRYLVETNGPKAGKILRALTVAR